ncbi:hypothetical protein [Parapedobacter sp. 10938]|uniref:hypothetical protein n=1 Tax=Parapedobacter flavus TaxID=3110225 RepID=UPI002DBDB1E8|nr:hypothetical protein [Parapedobacter sp. 10938]MEC3880221.1 hypothetical protein [Parapedobacter sp. 10938]
MKIKTPIIFFIIVIILSCKPNLSNCIIYQTNINIRHELFTHQLTDENHHYLFGVIEVNKLDFRTSEITIQQTNVEDMSGGWRSIKNRIPGKCQAVCQTKEYIYLISRQHYKEKQSLKYSVHKLYKISKENKTIVKIHEWDNGNAFVKDVFFDSEERGYVIYRSSNISGDYQVLSTMNGGKSWTTQYLNKSVDVVKFMPEKIFFISSKRNKKTNWIYSITKKNNELDSVQVYIKDIDIVEFSVDANGSYWLLSNENNKFILHNYKNGKSKEIEIFSQNENISIHKMYKYNDAIVIIASEVDHSMHHGFGGSTPIMYISKDNGLTWNNQHLRKALYLEPVSFYKDSQIVGYIGQGKVLTCELINKAGR